jgi:anti-sigma factor RsiW
MSADHLTSTTVGALVDGELSNGEQREAQAHLQECHSCSLRVLAAHQLKSAVRHAAHHSSPSQETLARLSSLARQTPPRRLPVVPLRPLIWTSVAALLLIALLLGGWRQSNQQAALTADLLDQHLASLSDASSPQVISTDRHTVKPWFQGKLPFSFNIPEANAFPPETVLQGADFTYVEGKPAALLLFSIRKHRASVFVTQGRDVTLPGLLRSRAGFNISYAHSSGLDLAGVSDVNRSDLDMLISTLANAQ